VPVQLASTCPKIAANGWNHPLDGGRPSFDQRVFFDN